MSKVFSLVNIGRDTFIMLNAKENLKKYQGTIKESYTATNGDLIHFVNYEKGTILVQDKDKL